MEGEFTKGVLTCLAKHAKPEVASRLAHGSQDVRPLCCPSTISSKHTLLSILQLLAWMPNLPG